MQAPQIVPLIPTDFDLYVEPFVGGGSIAFAIAPHEAILNDANKELINFYVVVRDEPVELLALLESWPIERETFYEIRAWDRAPDYMDRPAVERAARFAYLCMSSFNGWWRVNRYGYYNNSYGAEYPGRKKRDMVLTEDDVMAVSAYLNEHKITLRAEDFEDTLRDLPPKTFVFLDPPYVPKPHSADPINYTADVFSLHDHQRLKTACDKLTVQGIKWLQTNSGTDFVRDLYRDYDVIPTSVFRTFSGSVKKRKWQTDLLIKNF